MGRRRKTSALDDLVEIVSLMPWWAGVGLALATYLVFHSLAKFPTAPVDPSKMGDHIQKVLVAGWSLWLQYLVPFICLLGAGISFFKRRKRTMLVETVAAAPDVTALNGISWPEFELLVGEAFRLQGYTVIENAGRGPDGGVDLELRKGGQTFLVQCKQWKSYTVDVKVVRELYGVIAARKAAGGFVVTSGSFTLPAKEFANGKWLHLIEGPQLHEMIKVARAAGTNAVLAKAPSEPQLRPAGAPECPICKSSMVVRTANRGAKAGTKFWGCSRFPTCRGTRDMEMPNASI